MKIKKSGSKGGDFEERLRTYFDQSGFFAVRSIPFVFEGDDVSDVDVWLYERPNAVSRRRTIIDAKNRQRPKAVERILWLKGFQEGLKAESALLATTDRRASVRRFAASLGVSVLDGEAIERLINAQALNNSNRLSMDEFYDLLMEVDSQRGVKEWRPKFDTCKSGLVLHLGFPSANENIEATKFFLDHASIAADISKQVALRAFFVCAAYASISLDYAIKDWSFRSLDERQEALKLGLRFGEESNSSTLEPLRIAIGLVRQYVENGNAIARQIETRFYEEARRIPVEILSEFIAKIGTRDTLFKVGKELDAVGHSNTTVSYENLTVEAKSFVGVLLDYLGISRKSFAALLPLRAVSVLTLPADSLPLLDTGQK